MCIKDENERPKEDSWVKSRRWLINFELTHIGFACFFALIWNKWTSQNLTSVVIKIQTSNMIRNTQKQFCAFVLSQSSSILVSNFWVCRLFAKHKMRIALRRCSASTYVQFNFIQRQRIGSRHCIWHACMPNLENAHCDFHVLRPFILLQGVSYNFFQKHLKANIHSKNSRIGLLCFNLQNLIVVCWIFTRTLALLEWWIAKFVIGAPCFLYIPIYNKISLLLLWLVFVLFFGVWDLSSFVCLFQSASQLNDFNSIISLQN